MEFHQRGNQDITQTDVALGMDVGRGNICESCLEILGADANFCSACGHRLSNPAPQPHRSASVRVSSGAFADQASRREEGERRQATVMFSDLSGFTQMNEKLDPEEVEGIMSRVKAEAVRIVESHGGIVNQFVGDEVLALFGIPTAHDV